LLIYGVAIKPASTSKELRVRKIERLVDRGYRLAYRIAFPIARFVWRYYRHDGTMIAVWVGDRLLVVRHSYKIGLSMPGGGIKAGEERRLSAMRELREEVGIHLEADALIPVPAKRVGRERGYCCVYETFLDVEPRLMIDRREIISAAFVSVAHIDAVECDQLLRVYLQRVRVYA
jgi:8-oxo-dGTP diphosphatase